MQIIKYQFPQCGDGQGQLVALEEFKDIPIKIKRVFFMYGTDAGGRGNHGHRSLEQILICIHGSCKILLDDGTEKKEVFLEKPYEGLYFPSHLWGKMYDFSEDAVLLCLASELYNEDEYIRDYNEFLEIIKNKE